MTAAPLCDRTQALAAAPVGCRRPGLALVATVLASSLDFMDGSVINVSLPAIGHRFAATAADQQWVINAYLLPLSALLLFGGALGDRFGRRRLLLFGIAAFAAGSAACAIAPTLPILILARALQGAAAALVLPNSLAVLGGAFEGPARGRAIGVWAASAAMAAAVGPVLGGWLTDTVGWRAIFLINLPPAALAVVVTQYGVQADTPRAPGARLDLAGAVLAATALGALTLALTRGTGVHGWSAPDIAAVVAGAALAAAFVWIERRRGNRAMTPPALFASRPLVALNLLTLLLYAALAGFTLLLPYLLITVRHWPATLAGAALLPFPIIMGLASPLAGRLAGRIGAGGLLVTGSILVAIGCGLAHLATAGANYWTGVAPAVATVALGMACAAAPLTAAVLDAVDESHAGAASGLNSALAQLGGVIAVALVGGVLARRGAAFVAAFDHAAWAGAATALAAGATVAVLYRNTATGAGSNARPGARAAPPHIRRGRSAPDGEGRTHEQHHL